MNAIATVPVAVGDVLSHQEVCQTFHVGISGGIRYSKRHKWVVLIADYRNLLYDNRWANDIFYYTGTGQEGNQSLTHPHNARVCNSTADHTQLFVFEVSRDANYHYSGQFELAANPFTEIQTDINATERWVWVFPLRAVGGMPMHSVDMGTQLKKDFQRAISKLSNDELERRARRRSKHRFSKKKHVVTDIARDPYITAFIKRKAGGVCQLCGMSAPFLDKYGEPYLEHHHIEWLSKGGADSINNSSALCPNCHRKMHVVNDPMDKKVLIKKARIVASTSH